MIMAVVIVMMITPTTKKEAARSVVEKRASAYGVSEVGRGRGGGRS